MTRKGLKRSRDQRMELDQEELYEQKAQIRGINLEESSRGTKRLPVKLIDGSIRSMPPRPVPLRAASSEATDLSDETMSDASESGTDTKRIREETLSHAAGPSIASRRANIQQTQEQIALLCQSIVETPEESIGRLKKLHAYVIGESHELHSRDPLIKKLALLSELAVFKDIIPGYRIRLITEAEKAVKVTMAVKKQRDFEQGLLAAYKTFLESMEDEIKKKSEIAPLALQSMCTLLVSLTHFNFRTNLMSAIVSHLSKRGWDPDSDMCLTTIISVFRNDLTGVPSLEIVRLLNRMIKERSYRVHPNVLACLLHLRLKSELMGIRASQRNAGKDEPAKPRVKLSKKDKKAARPHLSKKARETRKELKVVEREMAEAEAEVDEEDRATQQTETLKLLFVLYFSIIKNPLPTRLLPVALEGISRYAHLVNIDFFRDLIAVLRTLVVRHEAELEAKGEIKEAGEEEDDDEEAKLPMESTQRQNELLRRRLLCISTAFELLSGQGEAITIDLGDFADHLYGIILDLATGTDIEVVPQQRINPQDIPGAEANTPSSVSRVQSQSIADLLFRTLYLIFNPRTSFKTFPPWRSAAFAKRILMACLSWPPASVLRALELVEVLLNKEPRLEALLSTDDRTADGVYRGDLNDPQLCNAFASNFWELRMLESSYFEDSVRKQAARLSNYSGK